MNRKTIRGAVDLFSLLRVLFNCLVVLNSMSYFSQQNWTRITRQQCSNDCLECRTQYPVLEERERWGFFSPCAWWTICHNCIRSHPPHAAPTQIEIPLFSFFFFLSCFFHTPTSSFWTSRYRRCRPFFPPVLVFNFYRA